MIRGRDGRRSRKPGARACRCGQSNGSWASTGPPSGVIWRPEVLQDGSSGWCPIRRHRIPWQRNGVTFSLNTYPDISPDLRQPQPDDRATHVVHFTAAVYTHFMANLLTRVPKRAQPGVATQDLLAWSAPSTSNCLLPRSTANWTEWWNNSGSPLPRWPNCWRMPRRTSWPSRPSQWPTGRSCGPTWTLRIFGRYERGRLRVDDRGTREFLNVWGNC